MSQPRHRFEMMRRHAEAGSVHPSYLPMLQQEMLVLLSHIDQQDAKIASLEKKLYPSPGAKIEP